MACLHFKHPNSGAEMVGTVASSSCRGFWFFPCDVPLHFINGKGKSTRTIKIQFTNSRDDRLYPFSLPLKHSRSLKKTNGSKSPKINSFRAFDTKTSLAMPVHREDLADKICETIQQNCKWEDVINLGPQDLEPNLVVKVLDLQACAQNALRFFNWADRQEGYEHNTDVYYTILSILGRAGMFDEMLSLKKMRTERCEITNSIVNSYGMIGKLQETQETIDLIEEVGHKPSLTACNSLLTVLIKNKMFDRADNVFIKMAQNGIPLNRLSYTLKIQLLFLKGNREAALDTLQEMIFEGCAPDVVTFTIVISHLCKLEEIELAYVVFRNMHAYNCEPNIYTYNFLAKGLFMVGKAEDALQLVNSIDEKGLVPNIHTYTILIDGLCKAGDLDRANGIFQEALARGLKPNTVTYNAMITGHSRNCRWDEAIDIFKVMQENGCSPDSITYNFLIQGLVKRERVPEAFSIYIEAIDKEIKINLHSIYCLARGLNRIGNHKDASIVFKRLQEVGHPFDANDYFLGVMSYSKVGAMNDAVGLIHEMISRDFIPNSTTYNMVIKGFSRQRRMEDAKAILNFMIAHNTVPNLDTYNLLINGFLRQKRTEEADQIYLSALNRGVLPSRKRDV